MTTHQSRNSFPQPSALCHAPSKLTLPGSRLRYMFLVVWLKLPSDFTVFRRRHRKLPIYS